ncbi:MAG: acyl-CoA reductase [Bacteroidetes bacterium]|nr:acyl-CoA reductase [Bacteroidota bacterium]
MNTLQNKLQALSELGSFINDYLTGRPNPHPDWALKMEQTIEKAEEGNPWFTREFIHKALGSISEMLDYQQLIDWTSQYNNNEVIRERKRVGVISAGNIPLVGFHDLLCVFLSGHEYKGRLSSGDSVLLPVLTDFLTELLPELRSVVSYSEGYIKEVDAVIATGNNNTFRYFDYYFKNFPRILRKNRNSVAVLDGAESEEKLRSLGEDIFLYFGLGCRNVSKLLLPRGYDVSALFKAWEKYRNLGDHNKYRNNYDYYKAIYLVNGDQHYDNGFVLLKPEKQKIASPVSVIYYEEYEDTALVKRELEYYHDQIQVIVSEIDGLGNVKPFGRAQHPGLSDYADGVDTMGFLLNL